MGMCDDARLRDVHRFLYQVHLDVRGFDGQLPTFFPASRWMDHDGYADQLVAMQEAGVMVSGVGRRLRMGCPSFIIPKKSGAGVMPEGRLILDCRRLNSHLQKPPPLVMPTVREVVQMVCAAAGGVLFDYRSYFYQIQRWDRVCRT